jgi:aldose 1-epimerase
MPVSHERFGSMPDGRPVEQFTLENSHGMRVSILTLGSISRSIVVPDARGDFADVVLGFDTVEEYLGDGMFTGALIGRYANRIARARFSLDGAEYQLAANDGINQLHGGAGGFHRKLWSAEPIETSDGSALQLGYRSPDGEEGFPGTLDVTAMYALNDANELSVSFSAVTDRATPACFTSHGYFNLAGHAAGSALGHELTLRASRFTPVSASMIPTGELRLVGGTPFDFRKPAIVAARLDTPDEQLAVAYGYDHNFVIDHALDELLVSAARLRDPRSGRSLELLTTEPGLQFYIGGGLNSSGKDGALYTAHSGLALEPQHFPNSPNEPTVPSAILRPRETLASRTVYRFGV